MFSVIKKTALSLACCLGYPSIVRALIEAGVNINAKCAPDEKTPLCEACETGQVNIVKQLIKAGANVNVSKKYGRSPQDYLDAEKHKSIIKILRQAGAR